MSQHHQTSTRRPAPHWTPERIRALGPVTDIVTAGQILGLSRSRASSSPPPTSSRCRSCGSASATRSPVAGLLAALRISLEPEPPRST